MKLVFRVDASPVIGSGHMVRCLTLARQLRDRGAEILFVTRAYDGHLGALVERHGFSVAMLPVLAAQMPVVERPDSWLGDTEPNDAQQTAKVLEQQGFTDCDWVVVDHYGAGAAWESAMGLSNPSYVMAIDDIARAHSCDLLLDQNLVAQHRTRYLGLLPERCTTLLGPEYALLQPEYKVLHRLAGERTYPPKKILAYFGATDPFGFCEMALTSFLKYAPQTAQLTIVAGLTNARATLLAEMAKGRSNVVVHQQVHSLAQLMQEADLAIGAGGATSWERLCLKLPAIVVTLAQNQQAIAQALDELGVSLSLGEARNLTQEGFDNALAGLLSGTLRLEFPEACANLVDGMGADRVVNAMIDKRAN